MSNNASTRTADSPRPDRAFAIALLLAGAVCAGMGQTIVFSVLPPLARELGIADRNVVAIFMISALCWVTMGPRWGRISDLYGRKPFILLGLIGFGLSMVLFGSSIQFGVAGILSGFPLYIAMVITRSFYGVVGSAGPPAAQAYIADRTNAAARTAGMASYSAAFGFGAMLGPAFGAATSLISRTAPFFSIGVVALIMSLLVFIFLPEKSAPTERSLRAKMRVTDPRLRGFLIFGLCFGIVNAIPIQTIAFYFIDALGYSPLEATGYVSVGLTCGAMASLFAQLVLVQKLKMSPRRLMRVAPLIMVFAHGLIWIFPTFLVVVIGMTLGGLGAGLAIPGFNAAASLAVTADEQGGAIGLANSAGASGFIVSPIVGISLYGWFPQAPFIFTMTMAGCILIFALTNKSIASATPSNTLILPGEKPASAAYK